MKVRHRPVADDWAWQQQAQCRGMDSAVFFSPPGERGLARRAREQRARAVCGQCPVRRICAATALRAGEEYGLWGGLSETDRNQILGRQACPSAPASARIGP